MFEIDCFYEILKTNIRVCMLVKLRYLNFCIKKKEYRFPYRNTVIYYITDIKQGSSLSAMSYVMFKSEIYKLVFMTPVFCR